MRKATRWVLVTGTDTGVGKTVFTAAFLAWLRERGVASIGFKPLASGGREDAEALWRAQGGDVPIDVVNPWHFPEPLSPLLAGRRAGCRVTLDALTEHLRAASRGMEVAVVEAAGGWLSPLMEGADAPEWCRELGARVVVVAPDRLGVVGQVRLVWAALSMEVRRQAQVVLMAPEQPDQATRLNRELLGEYVGAGRIHGFPRLNLVRMGARRRGEVGGICEAVADGLGLGMGDGRK